jgi:hypothetical protein
MKFNVGTFLIEDQMQKNGEEFRYLVSSKSEDTNIADLLTVHYSSTQQVKAVVIFSVHKDSPRYDSVDSSIDMIINPINIMNNRETVVHLIDFFNNVLESSVPTNEPIKSEDKFVPLEDSTKILEKSLAPQKRQITTSVKVNSVPCPLLLKLNATLKLISLTLNKEGNKLAHFSLSNASVEMRMLSNSAMVVQV